MRGSRGESGLGHPLENHKSIRFLSNTSDLLENYKATKPAFNVGSSSVHQRNAIYIAFRWRANDYPLLVLFGYPLIPSPTNKNIVRVGPHLTKLSGPAHEVDTYIGLSGLAGFGL